MTTQNRLRVVRAEKRMTQEALEERTRKPKISQSRLSLIENNYVEPTDAERKSIARALKVSVEDVFPATETAVAS